ncbi:MAG: zinc ribbon domain-containing protein [Syntrophales bacterium]|nr:zinc ribbon domain-containing protein [Syntrophales bacterium]
MFGISFEELILLLILALILFGPERLPEMAQKLSHWLAKLRQASADVTQQYQHIINPALPPPKPREEFTCPHCACTMEQRFTFCPHCGRRHEEETPRAEAHEDIWYVCPKCRRDLAPEFLFCPSCGAARVAGLDHYQPPDHYPAPPQITCPQCGRKLDADLLFCPGCGRALEKTGEAAPAPEKPGKSSIAEGGPGA